MDTSSNIKFNRQVMIRPNHITRVDATMKAYLRTVAMVYRRCKFPPDWFSIFVQGYFQDIHITKIMDDIPLRNIVERNIVMKWKYGSVSYEIRCTITGGVIVDGNVTKFEADNVVYNDGPTVHNFAPGSYAIQIEKNPNYGILPGTKNWIQIRIGDSIGTIAPFAQLSDM